MKKSLEHMRVYNEAQTVHTSRDTMIWLKIAMKEAFESLLIIWNFILNSVSQNNRYLQFSKLYVLDTKTSSILVIKIWGCNLCHIFFCYYTFYMLQLTNNTLAVPALCNYSGSTALIFCIALIHIFYVKVF